MSEEGYSVAGPPFVHVVYNQCVGNEPDPKTVCQLMPYLRKAFCETVCIELDSLPDHSDVLECDMVFGDLFAPNTSVGTLDIRTPPFSAELAARKPRSAKLMCPLVHDVDKGSNGAGNILWF